ncbi:hypothetical protein V5O48_003221 [Marasmius crinis-equi]|uniref:Glucose receptor Git3 N-terminal domain-containing protein n=1 Tax=Marasmius crinis-equi TaxID=585013 RepID=A0ABR3FTS1_9AGAR
MSEKATIWTVFAAALAGNNTWYTSGERAGVIVLTVAALLSLAAILFVAVPSIFTTQRSFKTHIFEYLSCLLIANTIQSIGTAMNLRWVMKNGVSNGNFCNVQGGIKQAGNLATALWSFMLAMHLFNILFMRSAVTKVGLWCTVIGGWLLVVLFVVIGPVAIQKPSKGPYFGVSGQWCWITDEYPEEQVFLEYFFEFLAAALSFLLYSIILLRVRGNLVHNKGKWQLKFISKEDSWRLGFARDLIDSSMLKVAQRMVWLPAWSLTLQIDLNSSCVLKPGFVNVMLILVTRRVFPDLAALPEFNTPRNKLLDVVFGKTGVTPFTLQRSDTADSYMREREARLQGMRSVSPLPGSQDGPALQRSASAGSSMTQVSTMNLIPNR